MRKSIVVLAAVVWSGACADEPQTCDTCGTEAETSGDPDTGTETDTTETGSPEGFCGDGVVDEGEACDEGPANADDAACTSACALAICGDGLVQVGVEECDDQNGVGDDGCGNDCMLPVCGDGEREGDESCDDGDRDPFDGCELDCTATSVVSVLVSNNRSCALSAAGDVRCWGSNVDGVLGYGYGGEDDCPGSDPDSPNWQHECTKFATCCLGDDPGELPTQVLELGGPVASLGTGLGWHSCALMQAGELRCWGENDYGQLGIGSGGQAACDADQPSCVIGDEPGEMPPQPAEIGAPIESVALGFAFGCALTDVGEVRCWGNNTNAQLGVGGQDHRGDAPGEMPPPPMNIGGAAIQVVTGGAFACALLESGVVRCWGHNTDGQLGYGHVAIVGDAPGELPSADVPLGGPVIQLAAGSSHVCALRESGEVLCWGGNSRGQLGLGYGPTIGDEMGEMPPMPSDVGGAVDLLVATTWRTCARHEIGELRCWGNNSSGQAGQGHDVHIGLGLLDPDMPPPAIDLGGRGVVHVDLSNTHTCALLDDGTVRCFGYGMVGALGLGDVEDVGDQLGEMPPPPVPMF